MRGIYLEKLENRVPVEKDGEMVEVDQHLPQVALSSLALPVPKGEGTELSVHIT